MTPLNGASRVFMFGVAVLLMVSGLAAIGQSGAASGGFMLVVIGGVGIIVLLYERTRYRSEVADRSGAPTGPGGGEPRGSLEARFVATDEVFVDPTTGHRMRVLHDPRTGERRYAAED